MLTENQGEIISIAGTYFQPEIEIEDGKEIPRPT